MYQLTLPLLGVAIAVGLVLYRLYLLPRNRQGYSAGRSLPADAIARNLYPAVSIRCGAACEAAGMIKGQRFLGHEAPPLPLSDCTSERCQCRYVHHVDRRTGNLDRRRLIGVERDYVTFFGKEDPREGRGRRASDWAGAYRMHQSAS